MPRPTFSSCWRLSGSGSSMYCSIESPNSCETSVPPPPSLASSMLTSGFTSNPVIPVSSTIDVSTVSILSPTAV
jgi:hypothetical protein